MRPAPNSGRHDLVIVMAHEIRRLAKSRVEYSRPVNGGRSADAHTWGEWRSSDYRIVTTRVPRDFADKLFSNENQDFIGPARYVDREQMDELNQLHDGIREWVGD